MLSGLEFKVFTVFVLGRMSGVKRQQEDGGACGGAGGGGGGPPQRKKILFDPLRLGPVSNLEEMDIQVIKFQHQKLKQVNSNF